MKTFKITDDVFKTEVLFVGDCTWDQFSAHMKRRYNVRVTQKDDDHVGDILGTVLRYHERWPYRTVYLRHMNRGNEPLAAAIHEIVHLALRICEDKGVPVVANYQDGKCGDETFAYLVEFFTNKYLKRL